MTKKNIFVDRWKSDAFENTEIANKIYKDLKEKLKYSPHPVSGWRSNPNQDLETVQINNKGLRSKPLELVNPKHANCMLFGGSVAWGFGASNNENIMSYKIEKKLYELFKKKINIINFAEQMHSSHEELMTFVGYLDEVRPEYVICFSGTNDINRGYKNVSKFTDLNTTWINFFNRGDALGVVREKNILKFLIKIIFRFGNKYQRISSSNLSYQNISEKEIPIKLFSNKIEIMNSICISKKIYILHILQPDLILKKKKITTEFEYFNMLEKSRIDYVKEHMNVFKEYMNTNKLKEESKYVKYLDLTEVFDKMDKPVFIDKAHLNDKGYDIVSEKIAYEIKKQFL